MKQLLSKYAPLSVELQKAMIYDQAVVGQDGTPNYVDNTDEAVEDKVSQRGKVKVELPKQE